MVNDWLIAWVFKLDITGIAAIKLPHESQTRQPNGCGFWLVVAGLSNGRF
jgi:hypothetical protein